MSSERLDDPTTLTWWDCEDCEFGAMPGAVAGRHADGLGHSVVRVR